jgi:hypothetical protein
MHGTPIPRILPAALTVDTAVAKMHISYIQASSNVIPLKQCLIFLTEKIIM